jgi:hypothetical protein
MEAKNLSTFKISQLKMKRSPKKEEIAEELGKRKCSRNITSNKTTV